MHYQQILEKDFILTNNLTTIHLLPKVSKIIITCGGEELNTTSMLSSVLALKFLTGQKPFLTFKEGNRFNRDTIVGGKLTLRKFKLFAFIYKLLIEFLPNLNHFEGFNLAAHPKIYTFFIKNVYSFDELSFHFALFKEIKSFTCQFHFTTQNSLEVNAFGRSFLFFFRKS